MHFLIQKKKQNQRKIKPKVLISLKLKKRDQRDIVTIEEEIVSVNERTRKPKKMQSRKHISYGWMVKNSE